MAKDPEIVKRQLMEDAKAEAEGRKPVKIEDTQLNAEQSRGAPDTGPPPGNLEEIESRGMAERPFLQGELGEKAEKEFLADRDLGHSGKPIKPNDADEDPAFNRPTGPPETAEVDAQTWVEQDRDDDTPSKNEPSYPDPDARDSVDRGGEARWDKSRDSEKGDHKVIKE